MGAGSRETAVPARPAASTGGGRGAAAAARPTLQPPARGLGLGPWPPLSDRKRVPYLFGAGEKIYVFSALPYTLPVRTKKKKKKSGPGSFPLLPPLHVRCFHLGSECFSEHLPAGPRGEAEGRETGPRSASSGCEIDCEQRDLLNAAVCACESVHAAPLQATPSQDGRKPPEGCRSHPFLCVTLLAALCRCREWQGQITGALTVLIKSHPSPGNMLFIAQSLNQAPRQRT